MNKSKTFSAADLSTRELYKYLTAAVAPRPIAFASTIGADGLVNLSPFSYFNVFGANPPTLIFAPTLRGRDGTPKDTLKNLREVPEVTINIVNYPMVEQMSLTSAEFPREVNEFDKGGFTEVPATGIRPPRVGESPLSFECTVEQIIETGQEGGAGNLVICRVVTMHIDSEYLDKEGQLDPRKLDLVARMGGNWYCRASGEALFEIPKPNRHTGIGVDALPASVRNSKVLTGNELGRLGNQGVLPDPEEVEKYRRESPLLESFREQFSYSPGVIQDEIHRKAKEMLEFGEPDRALLLLLAAAGIATE
jgi:flavin reductase (DIM6/NTAB) family NADH-FMN oxidoreductase RutF